MKAYGHSILNCSTMSSDPLSSLTVDSNLVASHLYREWNILKCSIIARYIRDRDGTIDPSLPIPCAVSTSMEDLPVKHVSISLQQQTRHSIHKIVGDATTRDKRTHNADERCKWLHKYYASSSVRRSQTKKPSKSILMHNFFSHVHHYYTSMSQNRSIFILVSLISAGFKLSDNTI